MNFIYFKMFIIRLFNNYKLIVLKQVIMIFGMLQ